ncbi:multiple sugar transport system permease protein [Catenulispora sp. EB89]|uniref:carbohydrate ABC transporter permease n=1 Tax=Catenulispora sp. EB89 TaxID=3156257 RepID=UPI003512A24D
MTTAGAGARPLAPAASALGGGSGGGGGSSGATGTPSARETRRRRRRHRSTEAAWAAFFLAPTALGLGVFYLWPVLQTFYYSFTTWGPFGGHTFTGLANYRALLHDPDLRSAFVNTLWYCLLGLAGIPIALVLAAVLARPGRRGVGFYRALLFLPVVTMPVAVAIVWRWLYAGDYGLINTLLGKIGIHGPYWISDQHTALIAVAVVGLWSGVGYTMVILMAGLESIPRQYYEAAQIDGAGPVRQFFALTLPLLSPSLFFVTVLSVIGTLQTFDLVYVLIGQTNPALPQTRSVVYLFYQDAFVDNNRGYAAAIAFVLLLVTVALTGFQFRLQKRWVHYA